MYKWSLYGTCASSTYTWPTISYLTARVTPTSIINTNPNSDFDQQNWRDPITTPNKFYLNWLFTLNLFQINHDLGRSNLYILFLSGGIICSLFVSNTIKHNHTCFKYIQLSIKYNEQISDNSEVYSLYSACSKNSRNDHNCLSKRWRSLETRRNVYIRY